jgi:hypothetical protein
MLEQLGEAIRSAAAAVSLVTDPYQYDGPIWRLRFGDQIDIRPVHGDANREASTGPMHPQMVAAYIAKYATKAADDFGLTPTASTQSQILPFCLCRSMCAGCSPPQ